MREIKFKAWNTDYKEMWSWKDVKQSTCFRLLEEADNIVFLQYTGLKDKNGVEIYEGDIVQYLDGNEWSTESGYDCEEFNNHGVIFFDDECGRFDVTNKQGLSYDDLFSCGVDFAVLGNKFENPELLEESK